MAKIINLEQEDEYRARGAVVIKRPTRFTRWYLRSSYLLRNALSKLLFWAGLNLLIVALASLWVAYKVQYQGYVLSWNNPDLLSQDDLGLSILEKRFNLVYDTKDKTCYAVVKPLN